jgi:hypothetical protein
MPRGNGPDQRPRRDNDGPDRARRSDGPRQPRRNLDEEVVTLRETGRSYAAVARSLGLKRAADAHASFVRALRSRPDGERAAMAERESGRLDLLETRIRGRDAEDQTKLDRRLAALEKLRQTIL